MSGSYSDVAIEQFAKKALEYNSLVIVWKRFQIDIFLVWPHYAEVINLFCNYLNNTDRTKNIQFAVAVAEDVLEFLHFKLKFEKEHKRNPLLIV